MLTAEDAHKEVSPLYRVRHEGCCLATVGCRRLRSTCIRWLIDHLALAFEVCRPGQALGSLIRHAVCRRSLASPSFSLCVAVIFAPLLRAPVGAPRISPGPSSPLGAAVIAAVGVSPIASAVDEEVVAAPAAGDGVDLRRSPAGVGFWTFRPTGRRIPSFRQSSEERGSRPRPPPLSPLRRVSRPHPRRLHFSTGVVSVMRPLDGADGAVLSGPVDSAAAAGDRGQPVDGLALRARR